MSNVETKYDFAIGFIIVLAINIAVFIATCILFSAITANDEFLNQYQIISALSNILLVCLLAELLFFSLVQYFYVVPLLHKQSKKGNRKIERGMLISSFFTIGLNCCWILVVAYLLSLII